MGKNFLKDSFIHHFLAAAADLALCMKEADRRAWAGWEEFVSGLTFSATGADAILVEWKKPVNGNALYRIARKDFYVVGSPAAVDGSDPVRTANRDYFAGVVADVASKAGFQIPERVSTANSPGGGVTPEEHNEEAFHDSWALGEDVRRIDVRRINESCTAPEMRHIRDILGNLKGKTLLDIGCGLGESSVYFALEGADVTAIDLSLEMLTSTQRLAEKYGVTIHTIKANSEHLDLQDERRFDIVYAGNLFHHVDIESTLKNIQKFLKHDGMLVSWDPVAYNPLINVYRMIAKGVRTEQEHPIRIRDIRIFRKYFGSVRTRWFWFSTLSVFLIMAIVQRRNPNKERFWKKVVEEGEQWRRIYSPLETLDRVILKAFPFLRYLCWNVVIISQKPIKALP